MVSKKDFRLGRSWRDDPSGLVEALDGLRCITRRTVRVLCWVTTAAVFGGYFNELGHDWFGWPMPNWLGIAALIIFLTGTRAITLGSHNDKDLD